MKTPCNQKSISYLRGTGEDTFVWSYGLLWGPWVLLWTAVVGNGKVTVPEAELFRTVADGLDCPMPPIRPGNLRVDNSTTTE